MKNIELTHEQAEKLLIMTRKLFPKSKKVRITYPHDFIRFNIEENLYKFHWFEFCMTYLYSEIIKGDYATQYQTSGMIFYKHPVDYLYEKFKKLK